MDVTNLGMLHFCNGGERNRHLMRLPAFHARLSLCRIIAHLSYTIALITKNVQFMLRKLKERL